MQKKAVVVFLVLVSIIIGIPLTSLAAYKSTTSYSVISPASNDGYITYAQGDSICFKGKIDHILDQVVCGLAPANTNVTDLYSYGFSQYVPKKTAFSYLGVATTSETDISSGKISLYPGENNFVETTVVSTIDTANVKPGSYRFFVLMVFTHGYSMGYYFQDVDIVQPAIPSSSTVYIDGKKKDFQAYTINSSNYFKLRDLAYVLSGSSKQFNVTWDSGKKAIILTRNSPYTVIGGEMTGKGNDTVTPIGTGVSIVLDSKMLSVFAYNIDNNNYFRLRDIAEIIDFSVTWDGTNNAIVVDTSKSYIN